MRAPDRSSSASASRRAIWGCGALLALAALAAYHNTFKVPFLFDDIPSIKDNATIRHLWPIWPVLAPPGGHGVTVSGRPILNLSFALNYAVSGLAPWSYHALNLLIHLGAGLTLFGLVRRTLALAARNAVFLPVAQRWTARSVRIPGAGALSEADLLALGSALLWLLHPLQTEAVTYIVQRTESMMALFFLLTFYCFVRSLQSPRIRTWRILAVGACLLSVGTKEVAVAVPVLLFIYDRTFVAGSFAGAWRRRRWFHLAIAATWLPLLALVASTGWNRGGTAGFNVGVAPWAYWFTQFEAVARYFRQMAWPHPLVIDYGTFFMTAGQAAPYALVVVPVALATLYALWRHPVPGFLGGCFFAILAPTSLVPGTIQMIVEHRLYLPLAAVIVLVVGAAAAWWGARSALALCLALAVPEGWLTLQRNRVYRSDLSLWRNTVAHSPDSTIAQGGLAGALYARGDLRGALFHYEVSCSLNPKRANAHYNLGLTLLDMHHLDRALAEFREAIRLNPHYAAAEYEIGLASMLAGRPQEAPAHFKRALAIEPSMAPAEYEWGVALAKQGRPADAIPHYREALRLSPGRADVESDLGVALYRLNRLPEAVAWFQRALRAKPDLADAHFNLGLALDRLGRTADALAQFADATRLDPNRAKFQFNLGLLLARAGRATEALGHLQKAVQLQPAFAEAQYNLGITLARLGRPADAIPHYREAVRLKPEYAEAEYGLGVAFYQLDRLPEAVASFRRALQNKADFTDAHFNLGLALDRLGRTAEALAQYADAARLNPNRAEIQLNLGIALAQVGRMPEALHHLKNAVHLKPRSAEAHCDLGVVFAETGRLHEAVDQYEAALRLRPEYVQAHYNLGNTLLQLRRVPEARRHFEAALRINPQFEPARKMLQRLQAANSAP